jgi:hypothetical protein
MPIPRLIHQTFFKKDGLHPAIQANITSLKSRNPEWMYTLYDDQDVEDFIRKHYPPEVMRLYKKIHPSYGAARADLFRYLVVYKLGGVYLDIKSTADRPLEEVSDGMDYVLSHWRKKPKRMFRPEDERKVPYGEYQNWHVIASQEHPFLKAVLDQVFDNIENYSVEKFGVGFVGAIRTTGPVAYTLAILPLVDQYPHRLYYRNQVAGLHYTVFEDMGVHRTAAYGTTQHYSMSRMPIVLRDSANGLIPQKELVNG